MFGFGKKEKVFRCNCETEKPDIKNGCSHEAESGTCRIMVLGTGCKSCHRLYENTKNAVKNMGLDIQIEYITDMQKIMEYGVMSMPAVVANEKVVSAGKVLKTAEIEKLINNLNI